MGIYKEIDVPDQEPQAITLVAKNQSAEITQLTTATKERVSRAVLFLSVAFMARSGLEVSFGIVMNLS